MIPPAFLIADSAVIEIVGRQLSFGRTDKLRNRPSDVCSYILTATHSGLGKLKLREDAEKIDGIFRNLLLSTEVSHKNLEIGVREAAALNILANLGLSLPKFPDEKSSLALSRIFIELGFLLTGRTFSDSIPALFSHFFMNKLEDQLSYFLRTSIEWHHAEMQAVFESKSVSDWLFGLGKLTPRTDSLYLTFAILLGMAENGLRPGALENIAKIDIATCKSRENEFDEIAAHMYSPGYYNFSVWNVERKQANREGPFSSYMRNAYRLAEDLGARAAWRQTRQDVLRLIAPPVFSAAAKELLLKDQIEAEKI